MKKFIILSLLFLSGCGVAHIPNVTPTTSSEEANVIKEQYIYSSKKKIVIAALLPLEGQYKEISEGIINAMQLAYNTTINKSVVIRFYSTMNQGADVTIYAAKNALDEGADIIVGPLFATHLPGIAKLTAKNKVPVISLSNDRGSLFNTSNIYIAGYSPEIEVERIVDYITNTQHAQRIVAMVPENKYGNIVLSALQATLKARGLELVRVVTYPPDTINFSPYVTQLIPSSVLTAYEIAVKEYNEKTVQNKSVVNLSKFYPTLELDFDTLFIGDTGTRLMLLGVHLPYVGINTSKINFIGTRLLTNSNLHTEKVFYNLMFPDFIDLQTTVFASKFVSIFKTKPTLLSAAGYDVIQMIMSLVKTDPHTGSISYDFSPQSLTNKSMFGVLGNFSLREDGLVVRDMEIKAINPHGATVVDDTSGYDFMAVKDYHKVPVKPELPSQSPRENVS